MPPSLIARESITHPIKLTELQRMLGPQVTLADICLVPQVYNAHRFKVPLDRFLGIAAVDAALRELPAFDAARPELQPDAE